MREFVAARFHYRPLRLVIAVSAWAPYILALQTHVRSDTGANLAWMLAPLLGAVTFAGLFPQKPLVGILVQVPLLVLTAVPFVQLGIAAPPLNHLVVSAVMFSMFAVAALVSAGGSTVEGVT